MHFSRLLTSCNNRRNDIVPAAFPPFASHHHHTLPSTPSRILPSISPLFNQITLPTTITSRKISTSAALTAEPTGYDAGQIQVLQGLDPVRKRPGMYIGSTGQRGLHHLIYEILDNSIDEVQAGHAKDIYVEIDLLTNWVTIRDDGRGIPTDLHPVTGKSALETVLTVLHAGGKFGGDDSGYSVSGGLHGVGVSVVNALSSQLEVTVWREGKEFAQAFARGDAQGVLSEKSVKETEKNWWFKPPRSGTQVRFLYDDTIFSKSAVFDPDTIRSRLRELAFLHPQATIHFRVAGEKKRALVPGTVISGISSRHMNSSNGDEDENEDGNGSPPTPIPTTSTTAQTTAEAKETNWETYHYSGGLSEYVTYLNRDKEPMHPEPISFKKTMEGVTVEVSMQWCSDSFSDTMVGFVNSIKTIDGGTHLDGFKMALTRTVNLLAKKLKVLKDGDSNLSGDHIREGLGVVVSVKVPNPEFEGQTKTRLGNPEVRKIVESAVAAQIGEALELDPGLFGMIMAKSMQAAKAAEAAKKARELVRRKSVLTKSTLPGKLADCSSNNKEETEIFLVEGDSAGGSAKQARDRRFQAILPLRGKILNVERQDDSKLYKNKELASLIVGLGLGLKGDADISSLRYGKIILLTDADVDGAHIRTLLLTFLFRYQKELFEQGKVYVGVPPLYKLELSGRGGKKMYCFTEEELKAETAGLVQGTYNVQRFKGLGEMQAEQLWQTTLNPETRTLRKLTLEDVGEASRVFALLMGDKVGPRRELIQEHGARLSFDDLDI